MADALYQNLERSVVTPPGRRGVRADHIYRMDIGEMIAEHVEAGADISISARAPAVEGRTSLAASRWTEDARGGAFSRSRRRRPPSGRSGGSRRLDGQLSVQHDVLCKVLEADTPIEEPP